MDTSIFSMETAFEDRFMHGLDVWACKSEDGSCLLQRSSIFDVTCEQRDSRARSTLGCITAQMQRLHLLHMQHYLPYADTELLRNGPVRNEDDLGWAESGCGIYKE